MGRQALKNVCSGYRLTCAWLGRSPDAPPWDAVSHRSKPFLATSVEAARKVEERLYHVFSYRCGKELGRATSSEMVGFHRDHVPVTYQHALHIGVSQGESPKSLFSMARRIGNPIRPQRSKEPPQEPQRLLDAQRPPSVEQETRGIPSDRRCAIPTDVCTMLSPTPPAPST